MSNYVPIETHNGVFIWTEVDDQVQGYTMTGVSDKIKSSFDGAVGALKENANFVIDTLKSLNLDEIEVTCGIKVGIETKTPIFVLAKANSEASYTIKLKWKADKADKSSKTDDSSDKGGEKHE